MTTAVSVIVPCYNHGHYLSHAIRSVLAQTFTHWEAIIVDDGSTDNTREVAAQFADPRVRYIYQANQGLSAARNTGILAAGGEYFAFLDADDEWEPRFLEQCVYVLTHQEMATAVVTLVQLIDESGAKLPRLGGQVIRSEEFRERLIEGGFFPPNAIVVQGGAVRRAGLFDESLTSVEDWDLWLRITDQEGTMQSVPEPLARYRISTGSMSTNASRMHTNRMAVLAKQFGPPDGKVESWPAEKQRAYAFAYRSAAYGYLQQQEPDTAWRWLDHATRIWPPIFTRLDTFYELALGDQPRSYRGNTTGLDLTANGADMLRRLDQLFESAGAPVKAQRGLAYGNAYQALGMLADQAGDWAAARRYLLAAARSNPRLLRDSSLLRRLAKVSAGRRAVQLGKRVLRQE